MKMGKKVIYTLLVMAMLLGVMSITSFATSEIIPVASVYLNKSELEIEVGDTETLVATVLPTNATNKTLIWSTTNANVASVINGKITPKSEGVATITVTTVDGGMTATCEVTVKGAAIPVESITLNKTSLRLWTGTENEETLQATIYPMNASNKNITWISSNSNIATVDANGKIIAKSKGQTTITATTNDGSKQATCVVNVHYGTTVSEFMIWETKYGTQYLTSEDMYYKNHILDISWTPIISRLSGYSDYDMYSIVVFDIVSDTGETYRATCQPYYAPYNSLDQQLKYSVPAGKTYTIKATLRLGYTEGYYFVEKGVYESNTITINLSPCSYYKTSFDDEYLAKAANCGSPAKYYANCQYCGVNYDKLFSRGEINPENHECGEWEYVDEHYHSRTCECGNMMETGEHSFNNGTCEFCDYSDHNADIPEPSFSIAATNVSMGNNLDIQFAITKSAVEDWTGYYAVITKEYADGRENRVDNVPFENWTTNGNYYVVTATGIAAKEMSDEITVVIYDENGYAVSHEFVQSMRNYAMTGLAKATTDLQKRLFVDMLYYGAAAQTNFGYGTDNLATALLTAEQLAYGTNDAPALESKYTRGTYHAASNLALESNILFQIALKNITDGMYVRIEYTGHKGTVYSKTYDVSNLETMGNYKVANIDTMVIADARRPITIFVYNADGSIAGASNESIENYCAFAGASGLPIELISYADSAYAWLHRND